METLTSGLDLFLLRHTQWDPPGELCSSLQIETELPPEEPGRPGCPSAQASQCQMEETQQQHRRATKTTDGADVLSQQTGELLKHDYRDSPRRCEAASRLSKSPIKGGGKRQVRPAREATVRARAGSAPLTWRSSVTSKGTQPHTVNPLCARGFQAHTEEGHMPGCYHWSHA